MDQDKSMIDTLNRPKIERLPELLAYRAETDPDRFAIHADGEQSLTFRELHDRATRIADRLAQAGARPGDRIALYADGTIEYGKTYQYQVISVEKTGNTYAQSELSETATIKPKDSFAPAVPAGLSAIPGSRSIDLVWDRNTEKDFASYNVFRDGMKIADGLTAPAFSDRGVQPKVKVQYQVSAVDTAGNESARSSPVEATVP